MTNAIEYCQAVQSGDITACRKVKQATRRFLKDLKRKQWPYYYDQDKADQAINFVEILPTRSGEPLKLEPFQVWILSELFGWRRKDTGTRRYSQAFISFSRKNGKSFLLSCIASLYMLVEDTPRLNREILFVANTFKQAKENDFDIFASGLRQLAKKSPAVAKRIKINSAEAIDTDSGSKAVVISSNKQALDGYESDLAVIDEYALAPDRDIKDVIATGQVNSPNSLLAVISTSGNNLNSPMYTDYKFAAKVLSGKAHADDLFIAIYEQDNKSEIMKALKNPDLLMKSNPLLSSPKRRQIMLPKLLKSIDLASQQDNLLPVYVKNGNMWLQARSNSYMPAKDWEKATEKQPDIEGLPVWFGVDLSKSNDLTSVSWLIPIDDDKQPYLFADSHSWIATKYGLDEKIKKDRFDYKAGEVRGECTITKLDSGIIDYQDIIQFMDNLVETYGLKVQGVCYDPWSFATLIPDFDARKWPLVEVRQGRLTLSQPTMQFRDDVFSGKLKHADNQLLAHAVNNAILTYDRNQNPLIDKARSQNKIDPLAALMNSYTQSMNYWKEKGHHHESSYYESDEFTF